MARKSAADFDPAIRVAREEFDAITEVKYEVAKDVYDAQDAKTKKVIDKMADTMLQYASTTVSYNGVEVDIDEDSLRQNLLYLAVEVCKDLALCDVRVSNFTFLQDSCIVCGTAMTEREDTHVGRGKR